MDVDADAGADGRDESRSRGGDDKDAMIFVVDGAMGDDARDASYVNSVCTFFCHSIV